METMNSKPVVLVVDDERPTVRLLQLNLEAEGYEVMTAFNGPQALRQVAQRKPDLIILDIIMPDMDGYEVLERLRSQPETADIPVVLLTGRRSPEEMAEGWSHDIDVYLTKPYKVEDLLSIVHRILEARKEEQLL